LLADGFQGSVAVSICSDFQHVQSERPQLVPPSHLGHGEDKLMAIYSETVRCGILHADGAIRNLVWDKEADKWWVPLRTSSRQISNSVASYLVDWEHWHFADEKTAWEDRFYISWNLAREGPSHNLFDMSDWRL
jgi:hypothetical protein